MKLLRGRKTYLVSAMMLAGALAQVYFGSMTMNEFLMSDQVIIIMEALGLGTLRAGLAKGIVIR